MHIYCVYWMFRPFASDMKYFEFSFPAESQAMLLHAERELRKALDPLAGRLFEALHNQTGGLRFLSDMRADLLQSLR